MSREILVYADWRGMDTPHKVGVLRADIVRGSEHFSFSYDLAWLTSDYAQQIDPKSSCFKVNSIAKMIETFVRF